MNNAADQIYLLLSSAAAAQGLLAGVLIAAAGGRRPPLRLLGLFVCLFGLTFLGDVAEMTGLLAAFPAAVLPFFWPYLLIGPVLYLYVDGLTGGGSGGAARRLHLAAAGAPILLSLGLFLFTADEQAALMSGGGVDSSWRTNAGMVALLLARLGMYVQLTAYLVACLVRLWRHGARVRDTFSDTDQRMLLWLRHAITALAVIWIMVNLSQAMGWSEALGGHAPSVFLLAELGVLYAIGLRGYAQRAIFAPRNGVDRIEDDTTLLDAVPPPAPDTASPPIASYAKSGLDRGAMDRIAARIEAAIREDALYRDNDLTLTRLAARVGAQPGYVTQTFSQVIDTRFYEYVAMARVDAAKSALADPDETRTVLDIALDCGFNTKSSFNAAFKRYAGMTPSAWRQAASVPPQQAQPQPASFKAGQ